MAHITNPAVQLVEVNSSVLLIFRLSPFRDINGLAGTNEKRDFPNELTALPVSRNIRHYFIAWSVSLLFRLRHRHRPNRPCRVAGVAGV